MALRLILAASAVGITSVCFYTRYLYRSLASQVERKKVTAVERKKLFDAGEIEHIPSDLIETPQNYRIYHTQDEKRGSVSLPADGQHAERLFTQLTRRNMICFSRMPQCWALRMLANTPERKQSFQRSHIESLNFQKGDLFCGFSRVLKREPLRIEIDLEPPEGMGTFSGRLIISLRSEGNEVVLTTQTLQWTQAGGSTVLPLEGGVVNFMHEMGSWWLIVSGLEYLKQIQ